MMSVLSRRRGESFKACRLSATLGGPLSKVSGRRGSRHDQEEFPRVAEPLRPLEEKGILERKRLTQEDLAACLQSWNDLLPLVERQNLQTGHFQYTYDSLPYHIDPLSIPVIQEGPIVRLNYLACRVDAQAGQAAANNPCRNRSLQTPPRPARYFIDAGRTPSPRPWRFLRNIVGFKPRIISNIGKTPLAGPVQNSRRAESAISSVLVGRVGAAVAIHKFLKIIFSNLCNALHRFSRLIAVGSREPYDTLKT